MEAATSFTSRRPAAGALPAFSLPPPTADVPRASDGLSPSLSSVNTGSSQGSQAPAGMQYSSYSGHVHGSWPTPATTSAYTVSSVTAPQPSLSQTFGRTSIFNPASSMQQPPHFRDPRSSQSPATGGEGLPPPPYGDVQHPFQTTISSSGSGGQTTPSGIASAPAPQTAILSSQTTQPPTPSSAPAHLESYTHTRPPNSNYYPASSAPQQHSFPAYAPQSSPTQHSPTTTGPISRGLSSISGAPGSGMAPPAPYRYPYTSLPTMGGSVLSNVHQPGAQMAMIPGMSVPTAYGGHSMVYGHAQPPPQSERPFKCDQCVQSFSRNHDLKRHKRIHLAVKPFPCTFCSKSFSRKDALKRHRLVKGCEGKPTEGGNNDGNTDTRNAEREESNEPKREP